MEETLPAAISVCLYSLQPLTDKTEVIQSFVQTLLPGKPEWMQLYIFYVDKNRKTCLSQSEMALFESAGISYTARSKVHEAVNKAPVQHKSERC